MYDANPLLLPCSCGAGNPVYDSEPTPDFDGVDTVLLCLRCGKRTEPRPTAAEAVADWNRLAQID